MRGRLLIDSDILVLISPVYMDHTKVHPLHQLLQLLVFDVLTKADSILQIKKTMHDKFQTFTQVML